VSLDAALVALSGRVRLREGTGRSSEDVIRELWESVFGRSQSEGDDGEGKVGAPTGATTSD
jgi:MoxR-like ATPase